MENNKINYNEKFCSIVQGNKVQRNANYFFHHRGFLKQTELASCLLLLISSAVFVLDEVEKS
jgi:hypothetical protein